MEEKQSEKVNLVITLSSNQKRAVALSVEIHEKEIPLPPNRPVTITLDKGEYDILFKVPVIMIKKVCKKYHIVMDGDKILDVKWSAFWGTVSVKEYVSHITL